MRDRPIAQMIVIGVVAVAIGIPVALIIPWFPANGARQAGNVRTLYDVLLIASVPIFVLVETVVLFSVWKFRMRPGQELQDGPPIHGNTRLEVVWTAVPAILIVFLCTYAYTVLRSNEDSKSNEVTINITERQFAFQFAYQAPGGKTVLSPQLYLAKDQPYVFKLRSYDVIHSFFVPEFSEKLDAVPGITTTLRVTPTRLGTYPAECTELCGAGHALMRTTVHVVTPQTFRQWLQVPAGERSAAGRHTARECERTAERVRRRRVRFRGRSSGEHADDLHELLERSCAELLLGDQPGGRKGRLHRIGRMRLLSHAERRRHDRHDRPEPRHQARPRREQAGPPSEAVHLRVHHEAERLYLPRLPAQHHAPDLLPAAVLDADPGAGQLHCERDQVRGSLSTAGPHCMIVILDRKEIR